MFCRYCGGKLALRFKEDEGLFPYCEACGKFVFPFFSVAVSMTVVNRAENKILLARHAGEEDFKMFAGYIKKGDTAEKTIPRELKEETRLNAVKWRYIASRFHEKREVLMLNFLVTCDDGEIVTNEEIEEVRWCSPDEAKELIRKDATADYFLNLAIGELGKKK